MPCRICGEPEPDARWEETFDDEPGQEDLRIGRLRHMHSGLELMGGWLYDSSAVRRCLVCCSEVPEDRVLREPQGVLHGKIRAPRITTGYESLCCGNVPSS